MQRQRRHDFLFDDSLQRPRTQPRVESSLGHVVHDAVGPNESDASFQHSLARVKGIELLDRYLPDGLLVERTKAQNRVNAIVKLRPKENLGRAVISRRS